MSSTPCCDLHVLRFAHFISQLTEGGKYKAHALFTVVRKSRHCKGFADFSRA